MFSQLFLLNGVYLLIGFLLLFFVFFKIQQPLKPSVFTILFIYHLLQIIAGVWLSNFLDKDIDYRSEFLGTATIYSYAGLFCLMLPIMIFQNNLPKINFDILRNHADRLSIYKSFRFYLTMFFVANFLGAIAFFYSGLSQFIISISNLKWFAFVLFGLQVFIKKKMLKEFALVSSLEFAIGFFSFFSNFKIVLIYLVFIFLFFLVKISFKQLLLAFLILIFSFYLGVKWTSVKGEYRNYLNQGSNSQTVVIGQNDAFNKLLELSDNETDFNVSAAQFFDRLQYTYHFAKTIERVPAVLPFENGGHLSSILLYVLTPRALNPDKKINESSKNATKYTGISYLGIEKGVSFSLGYFADLYIDFGLLGMLIYLILLGVIYGGSYYYFVRFTSNNVIFNYAFVSAIFMETIAFELDCVYMFGRLFANLIMFYLIKLFVVPSLKSYLSVSKQRLTNDNFVK